MNIILIGPPATGKGTQAIILSKYFNIPHISTGDIFRKNLQLNTDLGKSANSYIEKGFLVPDYITNAMIKENLLKDENKKGFILDGFPRNSLQAIFLNNFLQQQNIILTKVIYFNSDIKILQKRILGRRICPKCREIYHLETKKPKKNGICDKDNAILIQRKDDNLVTFNERLAIYQKETYPLIEQYRQQNQLLEIRIDDDNMSINDVTKILLQKLSKY
ncbi:MAG: nucleoside monophosphate kinase [Sweet potato little leaf phytoplasma]|uniref:adenylate kinase family protein n=1 Tax=Candidatus Phytoplasma australasiaticum TaxID=2754999 RepID=UPI00210A5800|nr:nucleoside monophosphate kinase [Sweet potato little leaf phytoplasma]MDO7987274.1 nucleoside monophosphate kinase [Sweet potato little leaf phytoplasma]MDO8005416.1 nucleoside monophosphate kinase [Sweet potato little leaf phytoplasma]MDO8008708.1 nucleoside monophosphate kinase [Sweet potato little leaf phytoplasma]MDO8020441.1 nucleoside monophosphate kinase [Sweet potato little leaf phytoplasma]MDV3139821.1 nucleoside monophosphate kinase [Sweet potato little leaf phytoplasma]